MIPYVLSLVFLFLICIHFNLVLDVLYDYLAVPSGDVEDGGCVVDNHVGHGVLKIFDVF